MPVLTLIAVAVPFVVSPGASFALTLAHATRDRPASWLRVLLGTGCGIFIVALLMGATGLGAALNELPVVRVALAVVGGLVLVVFGARMMFGALGGSDDGAVARAAPARLVRWSFLTLLTNPKALSLYVVVVPGLAVPTLSGFPLFVAFAMVHVALLAVWLFLVHFSATRVPGIVHSARTRRFILGFAGLVMAALGVATAVRGLG